MDRNIKNGKERANNIGLDNNMIVEIFELIHKYSYSLKQIL